MKDGFTRVLFLGNSYTYVNDLPRLFAMLCHSAGHETAVESLTVGGHYLRGFQDENDPLCAQLREKLATQKYDFAVLQEQSLAPVRDFAGFRDACLALGAQLAQNGARPVMYQTWGRKEGNEQLKELGMTHGDMTAALGIAYRAAATLLGAQVAPVGDCFAAAWARDAALELYTEDGSHPALAASYMAACCLYRVIFGEFCPRGVYDAGLGQETSALLQAAVRDAFGG